MHLDFREESPSKIAIFIDENRWKTVNRHLFRKELSSLLYCHTEEELLQNFIRIEKTVAKRYALFCVSKQSLFSLQLYKKLKAKELSEEAIDFAIDFCKKIKALNDEALAERFLERKMQKGFSEKFAKRVLQMKGKTSPSKDFSAPKEKEILKKLLEKKFSKANWKSAQEVQRIYRFFLRRGFSIDLIRQTLQDKNSSLLETGDFL